MAIVHDPSSVRPYVQLLNTSAWMLYASDLDPEHSHPEFAAYLLVHGDRMAWTGEITMAALHDTAYWLERSKDEIDAFADAAARSSRPDAQAFQALAAAMVWLRELRHETLRPPDARTAYRQIPGTGLLVPHALEAEPPKLVARWTDVARGALQTFYATWRVFDGDAVRTLCDWLAGEAPALLVTTQRGRILWDPRVPHRLGGLRTEFKEADGVAVRAIEADLRVIDGHTRAFHEALIDPSALPSPDRDAEQGGYSYLHRSRGLIAYNLREPGMERLRGPALPYARAMLGARTVHEWAHLTVAAGWVPLTASNAEFAARTNAFAVEIEAAIADAPSAVRRQSEGDVADLAAGEEPGAALAQLLLRRMPDYQANLVARRFLSTTEQETYVRQNIRTLRAEYPPSQLWRMLLRYLYEFQYLRFSAVPEPRTYFLRSTGFEADFFGAGVLDEARFDTLVAAVARLCASYDVDETRFRR